MDQEEYKKRLVSYFELGIDSFIPHLSINCIVFAYKDPVLKVLVQRLFENDLWYLPGGHVYKEEDLEEAAYRNLEYSGLKDAFLRQFKTFGDKSRVTKDSIPENFSIEIPNDILDWVTQRFVTVGYYALVDINRVKLKRSFFSNENMWQDVNHLDPLVFDHAEIVREARKVLAEDLLSFPVIPNLLPETFSMPELRRLYEAILNRPIDRGTFRRKMLLSGILEKVGKQDNPTRRPAFLYKLNQEEYLRSLMEETKFGF